MARRTRRGDATTIERRDDASDARERDSAHVRRRRRDVESLDAVRARREASRGWKLPRGARYVVPGSDGEVYELWAVRGDEIVLRSLWNVNAYLVYSSRMPPYSDGWR